ncbi:hypothetical protein MRX96_011317 [Rhipicephalus microplus]
MADDALFEFLLMEMTNSIYCHDDVAERDASVTKLEQIGFSTGYRLVERLTKDWPRFKTELDVIKFICKEFWSAVYKKQIDNLRTNHHGVYVLHDNKFRFLTQMSNNKQYIEMAPKYLAFHVRPHPRHPCQSGHQQYRDCRGHCYACVLILSVALRCIGKFQVQAAQNS